MGHATPDELMGQAVPTVIGYFNEVTDELDERFGEGFSKKNPDLVASLVRSATLDMTGNAISIAIERVSKSLKDVSDSICSLDFRE